MRISRSSANQHIESTPIYASSLDYGAKTLENNLLRIEDLERQDEADYIQKGVGNAKWADREGGLLFE